MIALLRRILDPRERLRQALAREELPTLPSGHLRILAALRSDAALPDIGRQIGADPALTTTLLRTVNSAAFGLKKRVSSPAHAASLLGRSPLESLVLGVVVARSLPRTRGFDHRAFWRLSAQRAATARALADLVDPRSRDISFTAGLLQDLALPLLFAARPTLYARLLAESADGTTLVDAETSTVGFDHAEVAGWLAETWRFPDELHRAIAAHHLKDCASVPVALSAILHGAPADPDQLVSAATTRFALRADDVAGAVQTGLSDGDELARVFAR
jgi:HD-like signal output (HDOD) protein